MRHTARRSEREEGRVKPVNQEPHGAFFHLTSKTVDIVLDPDVVIAAVPYIATLTK
jgi:hypothetical protein